MNLGDSASVLYDFDYNLYLPYTFNIQISDPSKADEVCNYLQTLPGVNNVEKESRVMNFLDQAKSFVNAASVISFAILFVIALFIIFLVGGMVSIAAFPVLGKGWKQFLLALLAFVSMANVSRLPKIAARFSHAEAHFAVYAALVPKRKVSVGERRANAAKAMHIPEEKSYSFRLFAASGPLMVKTRRGSYASVRLPTPDTVPVVAKVKVMRSSTGSKDSTRSHSARNAKAAASTASIVMIFMRTL